jgi:hypothetical protein
MKLTKEEYWNIQRLCEKFKGIGGKVEIEFEPGKIKSVYASVAIPGEKFAPESTIPPSLDHPKGTKVVDAEE